MDFPLTVDVTESASLYAGVSGSSTSFGSAGFSSLQITSWNIGFQADLYEQNGGTFPTVTLQSTITKSIPDCPLSTTSFNNILEFDYALDSATRLLICRPRGASVRRRCRNAAVFSPA